MNITTMLRKLVRVPVEEDAHLATEIGEKRTTVLGYILLTVMVILGFWQGQSFIDKVASNISLPASPSSCVYALKSRIDTNVYSGATNNYLYYGGSDFTVCTLTPYELAAGFAPVMQELKVLSLERQSVQSQLMNLDASKSRMESALQNSRSNYDLSLQEIQAGVKAPTANITAEQAGVASVRSNLDELNGKIDPLSQKVKDIDARIVAIANANKAALDLEFAQYEKDLALANTLRALLEFITILPLFWFALRRYFIAQNKRAFTAIIWAAVTTIFAILFAQVVAVFIYDIIPHALVEVLMKLFAQFAFIATIAQYLLLVLVPAILGGIVYLIQKRVYNSRAVYLRAMKSMKCPNCSMHLRDGIRFCPVCDFQVKEKCTSCGADKYKGLEYCDQCGVKGI